MWESFQIGEFILKYLNSFPVFQKCFPPVHSFSLHNQQQTRRNSGHLLAILRTAYSSSESLLLTWCTSPNPPRPKNFEDMKMSVGILVYSLVSNRQLKIRWKSQTTNLGVGVGHRSSPDQTPSSTQSSVLVETLLWLSDLMNWAAGHLYTEMRCLSDPPK